MILIKKVDKANIKEAAKIHSVSWQKSHSDICNADFIQIHTPERQEQYIVNKLRSGSEFYILFAGEKPVGVVSIKNNIIEDLYVLPDEQNKGYGSKLLVFVMKKCDKKSLLWILETNTKAENFYKKFGFKRTGKTLDIGKGLKQIEFCCESSHLFHSFP